MRYAVFSANSLDVSKRIGTIVSNDCSGAGKEAVTRLRNFEYDEIPYVFLRPIYRTQDGEDTIPLNEYIRAHHNGYQKIAVVEACDESGGVVLHRRIVGGEDFPKRPHEAAA